MVLKDPPSTCVCEPVFSGQSLGGKSRHTHSTEHSFLTKKFCVGRPHRQYFSSGNNPQVEKEIGSLYNSDAF